MKSVIFIDRLNLYYYGNNVHSVLTLPFDPAVVSDMEVINGEILEKQLDDFITKNKIEPTETSIILARQSTFEKLVPVNTPLPQIEIEKKKFLDNVPFQHIMDKSVTNPKGTIIIAINQELVYLLKAIFEKHHFHVESISSVGALYPEGDISFNTSSAQKLLGDASSIKQNTYPLESDKPPDEMDTFNEEPTKASKNKNAYMLGGVFVLLIGVLGFMIISQRAKPTRKKVIAATPSPRVASPTVAPSQSPSITEVIKETVPKNKITIKVLNGSGIAGQADQIKADLEKAGYSDVTTGNAPTGEAQKTLVVTKSLVSDAQKEEISKILTKYDEATTFQQNEDIDVDILITTAENSKSTGKNLQ